MLTDEEKQTIDAYNKIAAPWVSARIQDKFWEQECEHLKELAPSPAKVVDLGCGGGRESVWFEQQGYDYTGVDASEEMIKEAKGRFANSKFLKMDLLDLNFENGAFDAFWAAAILLHISRTNIGPVLQEIKRVVKPGAIGFISIKEGEGEDMLPWGEIPESPKGYFVFYSDDEFQRILNENNFKVIEHSKRPSGMDKQRAFLTYFVKSV